MGEGGRGYRYVRMWLALVLQALTCHHDSLSILEANEQAFGRQERHAFELQLPLDRWHRLLRYLAQVVFLPPQGIMVVCKCDGHEQHSSGSTSRE